MIINKARNVTDTKKKAIVLRKTSMNPMAAANLTDSQKQDQKYYLLTTKIDKLTKIMEKQHEIMHEMRNEISGTLGLEKKSSRNINDLGRSSHDFSSEASNTSSFQNKYLRNKNKGPRLSKKSLSQFSNVSFTLLFFRNNSSNKRVTLRSSETVTFPLIKVGTYTHNLERN